MPIPAELLGETVRKYKGQPTPDWIKGVDAGYDAAVIAIKEVLDMQRRTFALSGETRGKLAQMDRSLIECERTIQEFTCGVARHSIVSQDLDE